MYELTKLSKENKIGEKTELNSNLGQRHYTAEMQYLCFSRIGYFGIIFTLFAKKVFAKLYQVNLLDTNVTYI